MGHGNQPRPAGHSRWVPGAGRAYEQGFILRRLGSRGGIVSEGGVIPFAFWKDPSESSVGRAGQEATEEVPRCSARSAWIKWEVVGHPGAGPLPMALLAASPLRLHNHWDECRVAGGRLSATWPICIHRPYVEPAL